MSNAVANCQLAAESVRRLLGRTEYLAAFDQADHAFAEQPDDATLQWLAILALARAGAADTAAERLERSGLLDRADHLPVALAEDVLALEARIAKDRALAAEPARRSEFAAVTAQHYEQVFQRFRRTYTGITAADVALMMQEAMSAIDLAALGLPVGLGLRVGVHAGPVFVMHDPVRNETSYFGEHVTRAARIEPVAPPGAVFVTEAFAALLALERPDGFVCEYVGRVPTAKSFGPMPMHLLRRHLSPTGSTMT